METLIKQLVKEAVLEALVEYANGGVAALSLGDPTAPGQAPAVDDPDGSDTGGTTGNGGNNSGQGGGSESSSGGGTGPGGKPKPDVGVGAFGLR